MVGLQTHAGAVRQVFSGCEASCRVLLLGEDNPISVEPHFALYCAPNGCAGQRLQDRILEIPRARYLGIWRTNLCVGGWSSLAARERAKELMFGEHPWTVVVPLGNKVSSAVAHALGLRGPLLPLLTFGYYRDQAGRPPGVGRVVVLPHPSGRNPVWNDPTVRERARYLLREEAPELWG